MTAGYPRGGNGLFLHNAGKFYVHHASAAWLRSPRTQNTEREVEGPAQPMRCCQLFTKSKNESMKCSTAPGRVGWGDGSDVSLAVRENSFRLLMSS